MMTRQTFVGPWAGLPVAWNRDDQFDEQTYRADVARCCQAKAPGVYTGGTSGEFYAMELDEFKSVARATVEECRARGTPSMIGCTSTSTRGAARRAAFAAEIGANAVQLALPFWMEVADSQIVPFFREVADACDDLALSIYETTRAKKVLTLEQHRRIKDAVPGYLMVKANAGTVGCTPEGCAALSGLVNVFVGEHQFAALCPVGAIGCCSSVVYWNPRVILGMWELVRRKDWAGVDRECARIRRLFDFLDESFGLRDFTDTAFDRLGGVASGFLKCGLQGRAPYPSPTPADAEKLRQWYQDHFPEMLIQGT